MLMVSKKWTAQITPVASDVAASSAGSEDTKATFKVRAAGSGPRDRGRLHADARVWHGPRGAT